MRFFGKFFRNIAHIALSLPHNRIARPTPLELDDRYQSELARVEALAAGGMTYAEAWDRIRTAQPTTLI